MMETMLASLIKIEKQPDATHRSFAGKKKTGEKKEKNDISVDVVMQDSKGMVKHATHHQIMQPLQAL